MYKTETQIVSYGIFYLNPSSHQCQPSYKKYIAVQILYLNTQLGNFKLSSSRHTRDAELNCPCGSFARGV